MRCLMTVAVVAAVLSVGGAPIAAQAQPATELSTQGLSPEIRAVVQQIKQAIQDGKVDVVARTLSGEIIKNPQVARLLTMAALEGLPSNSADMLKAISAATVSALATSGGASSAAMVQAFSNGAVQAVITSNGSNAAAQVQAVVSGATQGAVVSAGGNVANGAATIQAATAGAIQSAMASNNTTMVQSVSAGAVIGASLAATKSTDPTVVAQTAAAITNAVKSGATDGAALASNGNAAIVASVVGTVNQSINSDQTQGQAKTNISLNSGQTQNQNQQPAQTTEPVISLPIPPHASAN